MTVAVCFKCGELKHGAFNPCRGCFAQPKLKDDLIISLAMSDHYLNKSSLTQIGSQIKMTGKPPGLNATDYERLSKQLSNFESFFNDPDKEEAKKSLTHKIDDASDSLNAIFSEMNDEQSEWDQFPIGNINECNRPIERKGFTFITSTINVWHGGECLEKINHSATITAEAINRKLHVTLGDRVLLNLLPSHFSFSQISENIDRIMWGGGRADDERCPENMSLFFKSDELKRIYVNVPDDMLIELYGNQVVSTDEMNIYTPLIDYFASRPFGSEKMVLTLLSTLPPFYRCELLKILLLSDPSNTVIYNKLSMAYLKNKQFSEAYALLDRGLNEQVLNSFEYHDMLDTLKTLEPNLNLSASEQEALRIQGIKLPQPVESCTETLEILREKFGDYAYGEHGVFFALLEGFCNDQARSNNTDYDGPLWEQDEEDYKPARLNGFISKKVNNDTSKDTINYNDIKKSDGFIDITNLPDSPINVGNDIFNLNEFAYEYPELIEAVNLMIGSTVQKYVQSVIAPLKGEIAMLKQTIKELKD